MFKWFFLAGLVPAFFSLAAVPANAQNPSHWTPGEVIVWYTAEDNGGQKKAGRTASEQAFALQELSRRSGVRFTSESAIPGTKANVLRFSEQRDVADVMSRLADDPSVLRVTPNHLIRLAQVDAPNDSLIGSQPELVDRRVFEAWTKTRGEGIVIAIIDTGIELTHPDLVDRLTVNEEEANGLEGVDDDGNGFIDDIHGYDFTDAPSLPGIDDYLTRDGDPTDDDGHGTAVAGVALASADNLEGIAGVAPEAKLLSLRAGLRTRLPFLPAVLQEDDAAAAIVYAADHGAHIINLSWGDVVDAAVVREAVRYAHDQGSLVIASSGNENNTNAFFPAAVPSVLSIGATNGNDRAFFSSYGPDLALAAPGFALLTTDLGGTYTRYSGTSFSAPFVAGVAALIWSQNPEWTAEQVSWQLKLSATQDTWTETLGWGIVDALEAVSATEAPPVLNIDRVAPQPNGFWFVEGSVAGNTLLGWTLGIAEDGEFSEPAIENSNEQRLREFLGNWVPPLETASEMVLRLSGSFRGYPELSVQTRLYLSTAEAPDDLALEPVIVSRPLEAPAYGLLATWSTESLQQGRVSLPENPLGERFAEEVIYGRKHSILVPGPLEPGDQRVDIHARVPHVGALDLVTTTQIDMPENRPAVPAFWNEVPPGTPMSKPVDFDNDGLPEVIVEGPLDTSFYGKVLWYEIGSGPEAPIEALGEASYRGIPRDVGDLNGNGRPELLVFRINGWEVYESPPAGGFPARLRYASTTSNELPLGFADFENGGALLMIAENRLVALDGNANFEEIGSAAVGEGQELKLGGTWHRRAGTSVVDVWIPGRGNLLHWFSVSPSGVSLEASFEVPVELAGSMSVYLDEGQTHLLTLEADPPELNDEGSLERSVTRARRWSWDGTGFTPLASVAFSGLREANRLQIEVSQDQAFLLLQDQIHALELQDGGLSWGGQVYTGPAQDRFVVAARVTDNDRVIWQGTPNQGVAATLAQGVEIPVGGELFVTHAREVGDASIELTLDQLPDPCGDGVLSRISSGDTVTVGQDKTGAYVDTLSLGIEATYQRTGGVCLPRPLRVTTWLSRPSLVWDGKNQIRMKITPGFGSETGAVSLVENGEISSPLSVSLNEKREEIRIEVPLGANPEWLWLDGARNENGLPIGGGPRLEVMVPPKPIDESVFIRSVAYVPGNENPSLIVELSQETDCEDPISVSPPLDLSVRLSGGRTSLIYELEGALDPGVYEVSLNPDCFGSNGLAQTSSFLVGNFVYPNPVRMGGRLHFAISPRDAASVILYDIRGSEVREIPGSDWSSGVPTSDLAPGLYILGLKKTDGSVSILEKVAVIR